MAAYGAQIKEGKTPAEAQAYLQTLFHNVVSQDSSARNALQTFLAGRGDALIDYEDEAIADKKKGSPIEYVIPARTILIQNPIAVVGDATRERASSSTTCSRPPGQQIWASEGLPARHLRRRGARPVPDPAGPVHDRIARRLDGRGQAVLRTGNRHRDEDRAVAGGVHLEMSPPVAPPRCPRRGAGASNPQAQASAGPCDVAVAVAGAGRRARGRRARSARACSASTCRCSCCCRSRRCWRSAGSGGARRVLARGHRPGGAWPRSS